MRKHMPDPNPWKRKAIGYFVIGEAALFIGAYYFYHKMNKSIDWRYYMLTNHKWALDLYYYIGEKGGYKTREHDYAKWGIENVAKKPS